MPKVDTLAKVFRILKVRRTPITTKALAQELSCSDDTARRTCEYLINTMHAPIMHKPRTGWLLKQTGDTFELPGIWLTAAELVGFSSILTLLEKMNSEFIAEDVQLIKKYIHQHLDDRGYSPDKLIKKVKIIPSYKQEINPEYLSRISYALIKNNKIEMRYSNYHQELTNRVVSPIRLVMYQDNLSLDAYCHKKKKLRTFQLSRIKLLEVLTKEKSDMPADIDIESHYADAYGFFAGKAKHTAKLLFKGNVAHNVACQQWHPKQQGEWQESNYILQFPYGDSRELVREILKYALDVEVLEPKQLKEEVKQTITKMVEIYKR